MSQKHDPWFGCTCNRIMQESFDWAMANDGVNYAHTRRCMQNTLYIKRMAYVSKNPSLRWVAPAVGCEKDKESPDWVTYQDRTNFTYTRCRQQNALCNKRVTYFSGKTCPWVGCACSKVWKRQKVSQLSDYPWWSALCTWDVICKMPCAPSRGMSWKTRPSWVQHLQ